MRRIRVLALIFLCSCAAADQNPNIHIGHIPSQMPPAPLASPNAPPKIVGIWLSSTVIEPYQGVRIKVTTSTNVASVEARCEVLSYNLKRTSYGQFEYSFEVPELPPITRRHYTFWFIARNAAGTEATESVDVWLK
jgi:hypothetical protein